MPECTRKIDRMTNGVSPLPFRQDDSGPTAGIVTLTLEQPGKPVVVLDHDLIRRLEAALRNLPSNTSGLVLTSASERAFVAGADLNAIQQLDDDQLLKYLAFGSHVFGMISNLPYPTVAAIHGAVLGGGLELAMHCDALVASPPPARDGQPGKPYPVGLPEAGLQICPGWGGTNLLPSRIDPIEAIRRTALGQPMTFDEAAKAGMFDAIAPSSDQLLATAKRWILDQRARGRMDRDGAPWRWIGRIESAVTGRGPATVLGAIDRLRTSLPETEPVRAVLDAVNAGLVRGWKAALAVEQSHLTRLRNSPAGKEAITAFFAKTKK